MTHRANPFRAFPVLIAFLINLVIGPLAPIAQQAVTLAANDGISDYAQCQIGNPKPAALDCAEKWTNGILNATHNDYAEDEVVPQRLLMDFGGPGAHSVTITYMARKDSSGQRHAYDYLATWNHTYTGADRCQTPTATGCIGGSASTYPIPSDPNSVTPGGPQPTAAHELPQADRQFVMYGGAITGTSAITHSVDPSETGSDYGNITVNFTVGAGGKVQLLFGGHLAAGLGERGWGAGLGSAAISGGPYHIRITAIDGASIGNRDNQIMSNAITPVYPNLGIIKTADATSVNAGANIGFTITVTNGGDGVAKSATLSDPLPAGGGVNWEISPAYSGPGTCQISGNPPTETLSCAFGDLAAGSSASVHVQSGTTADSCGLYENTATADGENSDPVQASASTSVLCPDLAITKTTSTPVIYAGDTAAYTITVSNTGSGTATGVAIADALPSGLTWAEDPDTAECSISGGNLSCSGITIPAGGSFSVTVKGVTDADDCPSILNRATFTSGNDGSGASHPDGQGAQITVLCPDTSVQKTGNGPITAGDTATFTIVVTAGGTGTNQNVTLNDTLPAGLSWTLGNANDEGDCSIVSSALSCSFGDMDPGATKTVVLNGVTDSGECPSISNTATVGATLDVDHGNNSSTAQITVNCGDLTITKTPDQPGDPGGSVNAGDVATFKIVVANEGAGSAYNVTLDDTLPSTDNGWSLGSSHDEGDCTLVGDELDCAFGTLASGASRTVEVWTTATADDCGTLDNPLAQAHSSNDGNPADSGAIEVTCPDLEIDKSTDTPVVTAGDKVSYTVTVDNNGDGDAENVVISDTLPAGISWSEDPDSADCSISGGVLSCTVDIPAGESFSITVSGWTDADDCPSMLNRATYTSENAGSGASHPQGQGVEIQVNCPDVGVEKTAYSTPINAGDEARYTVTVTAGGTGTNENVALHDDLPPVDGSWSYQIASPDADDSCSIVGNDLDCSFGDMTPGQTKVVTLTHLTTPDDCGTLLNDVSVSADVDTDTDENVPGNSVEDVAIEVDCPEIVVEKTGSGTVNASDAIYFEITVSNDGEGDAYDFAFADTLPDVAGTWTLVLPAEDGCELNGLALTCAREVFAAGDSFTLRVEADTQFADCGELYNLASASASNEADEDTSDNSDDHTIVVECPDLSATKEADDGVVSAGQQIGFTMTVSNSSAAGTGTAYDVELNDPLPAGSGLDWSIDPANEDCEINGALGAQVLECGFGDLAAGESVAVHVVSDTAPADCATYPNEASVTATNHDGLNPSDDTTVECPGLNISKTADNGTIDAGELASYTVTVWNVGPGTALDASWSDELPAGVGWNVELQNPDGDDACASSIDGDGNQSASCDFGDLAPSDMEHGKVIVVSGSTDREDCGVLDNTAFAYASNDDTVEASASITVKCPTVAIEKVNDQPEPVLPGTVVSYTVTVTVSDGPAKNVTVTDLLPLGLDAPTSISDGGSYSGGTRAITWHLGDLADGSYELTYQAAVSAGTEHGDELVNVAVVSSDNSQCPDAESAADECTDDSTVVVRVPTLVIDKDADTEIVHFVFNEDGDLQSITPEEVTWTLSFTLANGPVTDAVISDPLPNYLDFVSASDDGVYDDATRTVTWELGTLTESGSVTLVTRVDPGAPETDPIVNVATIVSNETPEDDGEDAILITSESVQAGTSTPKPSVPDTALVPGLNGQPLSIPVELMLVAFVLSLGALALANVRAVRRRR